MGLLVNAMKTETEIRQEIEGLRNLTTAQLTQKYREVFGEESRSNHKQFLFRCMKWRARYRIPWLNPLAVTSAISSKHDKRRALDAARLVFPPYATRLPGGTEVRTDGFTGGTTFASLQTYTERDAVLRIESMGEFRRLGAAALRDGDKTNDAGHSVSPWIQEHRNGCARRGGRVSRSNMESRIKLNRRHALLTATAGVAGLAGNTHSRASERAKALAGTYSTPRSAVAKTQYGKVRGYVEDGVLTFKGVPYGADTGGENRWLPAKPPVPWDGEYPALIYGPNCPQRLHDWPIEQSFLQQWTDGWQSEDMLKLNIWTPSLSGRRPVMFYIHGGGFSFGSAYELASQDGAQMARHHDVVSVTVNHRLNVLGFLDLSSIGGPAYADSANVGMTDLVAALRWVRDNIAHFGGDPDRVMIYGNSGGGSKVTTLLGMPSAEGLIHRAAAQSGGGGNPPDSELSGEFAKRVFAELGVRDIAAMQKMEWARLNAAANAVAAKMNPPVGPGGPVPAPGTAKPRVGNGPTVDGRLITLRSFYDVAPEISKKVPVLFGSVSEEGNIMRSRPSEAEWLAALTKMYGESKAKALVEGLKKAHPRKSIRTLSYMCGSSSLNALNMRNNVTRMATLKHNQKGAPAFAYYFAWQSPMLEEAGAWHTSELAFCFDNTERCAQGTGNGPEARALAKKMATAWASFARTGNPSQPGLKWEPFDPARGQTMVFDNECRMVDDPEGELRKILLS